jgi:imidazole glycerol-phosphate synthase subunit HisF
LILQTYKPSLLPPEDETTLPRIIPCLLIANQRLVKTVQFRDPKYIGDPLNAVRIFNEKEADELLFLDITARRSQKEPDFDLIESIAQQCFMPFGYGGGIRTLQDVQRVLTLGAEKAVINSRALETPGLIKESADRFGSQSIVLSVDVKRNLMGRWRVFNGERNKLTSLDPLTHIKTMIALGAGEVLVNNVDRDGTRVGYDLKLISAVARSVNVPVVACGGAGSLADLKSAIDAGASAAAAGSLFVLYGKHRAALITYPEPDKLFKTFSPY